MSENFHNIFEDAFERAAEKRNVEYRDALVEPWGDSERMSSFQEEAREYMKEWTGTGPILASIGAKGSAKTHFGGWFANHMGQEYEESLGCVISNTKTQAKDNAGALFVKICRQIDRPVEYFNTKKIRGRPFGSVFVVDLDGRGFEEGKNYYMLVRTFEAVNKLEGIELDWGWIEEVQDAKKDDVVTFLSRVRGQNADNSVFIAGMPEDEFHWMYTTIPRMIEENAKATPDQVAAARAEVIAERGGNVERVTKKDLERFGIKFGNGQLWEPSVMDNIQNVGQKYIDRLYSLYDEEMAKRYIYGERTSLRQNKVFHAYKDYLHRTSRMAELLSQYDPERRLVMSVDFNVNPMSASVWQEKRWSDEWDSSEILIDEDGTVRYSDTLEKAADSPEEYASPNRQVLAQVEEFEIPQSGTEALMDAFKETYGDHQAGLLVLGDASGRSRVTASSDTDWDIIAKSIKDMPNAEVMRGLVQNSDIKSGKVKYSNPDVRDTINVANKLLRNAEGKAKVCFMPESDYKSGGTARSVAMLTTKPDGRLDKSADRREGRDVARTHFADTFRYVCWWYNGGGLGMDASDFESFAREVREEAIVGERFTGRNNDPFEDADNEANRFSAF